MSLFDAFRYDGKRALVVGGATGMGAAAAQLVQDAGAEVVVMDYAEVALEGAKAVHVNLAEKDSIEAAVDACGGTIDALFSCAGVADGTPFELVAAPVQYDNEPAQPQRAPDFNEHGDEILGSIGYEMEQIIDLKVRGVVT